MNRRGFSLRVPILVVGLLFIAINVCNKVQFIKYNYNIIIIIKVSDSEVILSFKAQYFAEICLLELKYSVLYKLKWYVYNILQINTFYNVLVTKLQVQVSDFLGHFQSLRPWELQVVFECSAAPAADGHDLLVAVAELTHK